MKKKTYTQKEYLTFLQENNIARVKECLLEGKDPNKTFPHYKDTPLHIACQNGYTKLVHVLIASGADINIKNKDGDTPLMTAIIYARPRTVRSILSHKNVDIHAKNKKGADAFRLAISQATIFERSFSIPSILLEKGADIDTEGTRGDTPLLKISLVRRTRYGKRCGLFKTIKFLIEHGASYKKKNKFGESSIDLIKEVGDKRILNFLSEQGIL